MALRARDDQQPHSLAHNLCPNNHRPGVYFVRVQRAGTCAFHRYRFVTCLLTRAPRSIAPCSSRLFSTHGLQTAPCALSVCRRSLIRLILPGFQETMPHVSAMWATKGASESRPIPRVLPSQTNAPSAQHSNSVRTCFQSFKIISQQPQVSAARLRHTHISSGQT